MRPKDRVLPSLQGGTPPVSPRPLEAHLREQVRGEVRFDDGSRALYATDASNYRLAPIGVVVPKTIDDVVATVEVCGAHGAPILSRGGGTSLAGQCCNVAVVIDWTRYLNRILEIDPVRKLARVQPGTVLDRVREVADRSYQLTVGPDPATHDHCTLGGMIGNNACGVHAQMAGSMADNVEELEILTYAGDRFRVGKTSPAELETIIGEGGRRGRIYRQLRELRDRYGDRVRERFPTLKRRISGYNLDALLPERGFDVARALVGTESTCVTMLEATVKLVHSPPHRVLLVLGYRDVFEAADDVPFLDPFEPIGLEGIDSTLLHNVRVKGWHLDSLSAFPEGDSFLILEFGGDTLAEARERARAAGAGMRARHPRVSQRLLDEPGEMQKIWEIREAGLGVTARVPGQPDTWEGWEDSAVPPENLGRYLRALRVLYDKFGYDGALYGHFGQGCVHTRITFDLTSAKGVAQFRRFLDEAADLCISMGGSLSGEHGDGQSRAELLPKMFGEELVQAFREFKAIWDPTNKMNPGRVVNPRPIDQDLRLGANYDPWRPPTYFQYPADDGSFARATQRCVGIGKCRRGQGGTMCPSFMATREEMHSTRGRAHLLFEMLQGDIVRGGWRDEHVKESLDLCLACKGCKAECPVNVDLATYKAEFLAHYYEGRLRPRQAYTMGLIMYWARLAALAPGLANFATQRPPLKQIAKAIGGIARERELPRFAPETFQSWFARRPVKDGGSSRRVMLWPDTFNNHFFPETARAAVEVLESAGFTVEVPKGFVCCGRPLYDFGMLSTAKRRLERTMETLSGAIASGTPIVGLEPSCVSVFRDELGSLFPTDGRAQQLNRQVLQFSDFLERYAPEFRPARMAMKALVQPHCHQESLSKMKGEKAVLERLGVEYEIPDSGCCGMAGAFGFERGDKYEVSMKCGERVLLPRVRQASKSTLIIADGFSCREQIAQGTDRKAVHLAQAVRMAQEYGPEVPREPYPERSMVRGGLGERAPHRVRSALLGAAVLVAGGLAARRLLRRV